MISVRSKLTKFLSEPELSVDVSIYIKALPTGGEEVAPELPVGLFVRVVFMNF